MQRLRDTCTEDATQGGTRETSIERGPNPLSPPSRLVYLAGSMGWPGMAGLAWLGWHGWTGMAQGDAPLPPEPSDVSRRDLDEGHLAWTGRISPSRRLSSAPTLPAKSVAAREVAMAATGGLPGQGLRTSR